MLGSEFRSSLLAQQLFLPPSHLPSPDVNTFKTKSQSLCPGSLCGVLSLAGLAAHARIPKRGGNGKSGGQHLGGSRQQLFPAQMRCFLVQRWALHSHIFRRNHGPVLFFKVPVFPLGPDSTVSVTPVLIVQPSLEVYDFSQTGSRPSCFFSTVRGGSPFVKVTRKFLSTLCPWIPPSHYLLNNNTT